MIRPKIETEDLLLSIIKNCETLIEQTHRKPEETLKFKLTRPKETFFLNPTMSIEGSGMFGLTDLEIYISIFNITDQINKFELYKIADEKSSGISYTNVRDEIERDLNISDITATDLHDDIIGPFNIEEYREQVIKK